MISSILPVICFIILVLTLYIQISISKNISNIFRQSLDLQERFSQGNRIIEEDLQQKHEVIIAIKQNNIQKLEELLYEVSNPLSKNYGKYYTNEEVGNLIANPIATQAIIQWLQDYNVDIQSISTYGEYITAIANISTWELLLDTQFHYIYTKNDSNIPVSYLRGLSYSIPSNINDYIHAIFRIADLPPLLSQSLAVSNKTYSLHNISSIIQSDGTYNEIMDMINPKTLQQLYNIPKNSLASLGSQSIFGAIGQTFLKNDLLSFQKLFDIYSSIRIQLIGLVPDSSICRYWPYYCLEASLDLEYINAIAPNIPTSYFYSSDLSGDFLDFIRHVASLKTPDKVYSISYGAIEKYVSVKNMKSFNIEAMKLGLQGVSIIVASGDYGISSSWDTCTYSTLFPAASPYVTTIGATAIQIANNQEIVCSMDRGSIITSGGGFSKYFPAPSFQQEAINGYISKYKPGMSISDNAIYNTSNRGYPDLSMIGSNYLVLVGSQIFSVSGTSASTPVFAGMISLVNDARIRNGLPTLGWLNPAIYQSKGSFANDIISGNNRCFGRYDWYYQYLLCCSYGYEAIEGWDPITGYGSVDYLKLHNYFTTMTMNMNTNSYSSSSLDGKGLIAGFVIGLFFICLFFYIISRLLLYDFEYDDISTRKFWSYNYKKPLISNKVLKNHASDTSDAIDNPMVSIIATAENHEKRDLRSLKSLNDNHMESEDI